MAVELELPKACELLNVEDEETLKAVTTAGFDVRSTPTDQQYVFKAIHAQDWHPIDFVEMLHKMGHEALVERYNNFVEDPGCGFDLSDMVRDIFYALARFTLGLPANASLNHRSKGRHLSNHYMACYTGAQKKTFVCRWCQQVGIHVDQLNNAKLLGFDQFKDYGNCNRFGLLIPVLFMMRHIAVGASSSTGILNHERLV